MVAQGADKHFALDIWQEGQTEEHKKQMP